MITVMPLLILAVLIAILANVTITIQINPPSEEDKERQCWDMLLGDNWTNGYVVDLAKLCPG